MNTMTCRLMSAHRKVDEEIRREQKCRAPDPLRLVSLKKHKLAVKDRMHRLANLLHEDRA
ncbi:MAG: hypothetical protein JWO64_3479 [Hyphomicrobiales bacterium]|jgi:hypothetical protein|nr:hypothetical protein [Hyphomicrobiales bacterium]